MNIFIQRLIITSLFIATLVGSCSLPGYATKIQTCPLPSERDLKDFDDGQTDVPAVSRYKRRPDYREEEELKKKSQEENKRQATENTAKAEALRLAAYKKQLQIALEANNKGVALGKQKHWQEAIVQHELAVNYDPQNSQYKINLSAALCTFGQEKTQAHDWNAAASLFRKALSAAMDNGLAGKLLTQVLKQQNHDPSNAGERLMIGDQLAASNDFAGALIEYQIACQLEPSARTYQKMGDMAMHYGQISTAIDWYKQVLTKDPNYGPAYRQFGLLQLQQKDYTGAASSLRKAVIYDAKDEIAGQALVEIWRRQVAANPLLAENHLGLAGALQLTGDFNGSEAEYIKLAVLDPNNPGLSAGRASLVRAKQHAMAEKHRIAAETLYDQGLKRESLSEIGQATMMEPKNAQYQFLLGECLEANGDLNGAHQAYLTAVLIDPENNKEAAYRMKEMQKGNTLLVPRQANLLQSQTTMQTQITGQAQEAIFQVPAIMPIQSFAPGLGLQKNTFEAGSGMQTTVGSQGVAAFQTHDESTGQINTSNTRAVSSATGTTDIPVSLELVSIKEDVASNQSVSNELMNKVQNFESQKDYASAIASLQTALSQNLQEAELHHHIAVDLLANGQITEAITEFRIACALKPSNKDYAYDLAHSMQIRKRSGQDAFGQPILDKEVAAK